MRSYALAGVCLNWDCDDFKMNEGIYYRLFRTRESDGFAEKIYFKGKFCDLYTLKKGTKIFEDSHYELYEIAGEKLLLYKWKRGCYACALWPDRISCDSTNICYFDYSIKAEHQMNEDWFMSQLGLHKVFLQKKAAIVHSSYIDYKGEAILFTAPSGTGKSTQADLWSKYANAEIINGDRSFVRKIDGVWKAFSYPGCGTSKICINRTLPIRAIVLLEQGEENKIETIKTSEKVGKIASAMEMYHWDLNVIDMAISLAKDMATEISIIKYSCRPDNDAVRVLKDYLGV